MELYVLNKTTWERQYAIDTFTSLIWTERWAGYGEFELSVPLTDDNRFYFSVGNALEMSLSYRVMLVDSAEAKFDTDDVLIIKGRSFEAFLFYRVARVDQISLAGSPKWIINNEPLKVAETMLDRAFINTVDGPARVGIGNGPVPADTITPIETNSIKWEQEPTTLYDAVSAVCTQYELGFRALKNPGSGGISMKVYAGVDRTIQQRTPTYPVIIFARNLDNLYNVTEFSSNADNYNAAQVISNQGWVEVYANGGNSSTYGMAKRTLLVMADPVPDVSNPTSAQVTQYLTRVGQKELAKHRLARLLDGEASPTAYLYQSDYFLGDIVEIRDSDGQRGYRRVAEQIFVSDAEGERTYPTLAATIVRT